MVDEDHPNTEYSDAQFIQQLRANGPCTTATIADAVNCTRRTADQRLKALRDDGVVTGELMGNSLVWSISE
jgi:DNA-binding Lrp family transcriptional regulator